MPRARAAPRPASWVVQHRRSVFDVGLLAFAVFVGAFFCLVLLGGATAGVVWAVREGRFSGASVAERLKYGFGALFGLGFGVVMLKTTVGSLLDLVGVEVVVSGPVQALKALRGTRSTSYRMVVQGEEIEVPHAVFATLSVQTPVWARAGRFERGLKELARPAGDLPRRR